MWPTRSAESVGVSLPRVKQHRKHMASKPTTSRNRGPLIDRTHTRLAERVAHSAADPRFFRRSDSVSSTLLLVFFVPLW
ncbi:MAG: hypothetical protein DWQ34_14205 [Planctomycetota bacterium]|nr:MAG: hypothetical protein DWQ29_15560 [Planctomycetota bacterium]REJ91709.1 MAG: hypothetical protein DWQ34_14205 [Planctomycetota bacterium]